MTTFTARLGLAMPFAFAALLSSCNQSDPVYVDGAYVRLNPNPENPAAGYFTIHGGSRDVTLRDVQTDAAVRLEMHESMEQGGMMTMTPLDAVDVPAHTDVTFAPGGKHIMLWQINPQAIAAGKLEFRMTFSNGDRLLVDAVIQDAQGQPTGSSPVAPTAK